MRRCHLDFESRSAADIWETGGWGYSTHPSTQVVCICFSVDNDPHIRTITKPILEKQTWSREMGELLFLVSDPEVIFYAHNAFFEQCIWQNIMVPKHGMPPLPIHRWRCTAAKANAFGLPSSLQNAALALGITEQKDMTGKQTMLKLCKPRAPKKGEIISGLLWYEDPEDYEVLYEYCRQDVRVERALDDALPDLNPKEQEVWFLDQKINSRGVRVDIEFIGKARAALAVHQNRLEHELTALTGGKVTAGTQVGGIVRYLQERGVPITDLRAGTVSELIASGKLDEHCIRVLKYRQELSKTSNAKYDKLATAMDSYGIVRDCFQYHTATTGRWGGKLVQLHNLPVNRLGVDIFKAIEHVKEYDYNVLRFLYGTTVSQVLSACLRGVLIPRDGKEFYVVDYSAIEARGVFWLAGEQLGLYEFRESDEERGPEIYVRMAQRIFGNPHLTKKDKAERNLGKTAILGCISEDTLICSDKGLVSMLSISEEDKVWNGKNWVHFTKKIDVGIKTVIRLGNIELTPDHLVMCVGGWRTAEEIVLNRGTALPISDRFLETGRLLDAHSVEGVSAMSPHAARAALMKVAELTSYGSERLECALDALRVCEGKSAEHRVNTVISYLTPGFAPDGGCVGRIFKNVARTQVIRTTKTTEVEAFTRPSSLVESSWNVLLDLMGMTTGGSRSIVLTTSGVMRQEILEWLRNQKIIKTEEKRCFDLVGVDNDRYQAGDFLVHNCGFGMGEARFVATCQAWGVKLPDSMWSREINSYGEEVISCPIVPQYRETYPKVPEFWRAMQNTAIEAVNRPDTPIPCGHVQWYYHRAKDYLFMRLPSGRFLSYQAPRVGTGKFGGPELSYMTEVNNQWVRVSTYGGHLVENATQAAARDLMAYSMVELEKAGMPVMIHTHDEIVTENDIGANRLEEMIEIMCRVSEWAQGFPIKADGFVTRRYVKQ